MFGLPEQSLSEFEADLEAALEVGPEHISAYGLTLHEGTPYARWDREGRWRRPESEEEAAMLELMIDRLAAAGFEHYEISNWAKPGRASRHNRKYWRRCDVYGFGASAHGVIGGRRVSNARDLKQYIEGRGVAEGLAGAEEVPSDERSRSGETMMLALRRLDGVGWEELRDWIGGDAREIYAGEIRELSEGGWVKAGANGIRLTRRGLMIADRVMEKFF
jgi:oxygen-independent coproporphyrinogen III oxidase